MYYSNFNRNLIVTVKVTKKQPKFSMHCLLPLQPLFPKTEYFDSKILIEILFMQPLETN